MLNNLTEFIKCLGSQLDKNGVNFYFYDRDALSVSVIGDFNNWDGKINPMKKINDLGLWHIFIPNIKEYDNYQYEIITKDNVYLKVNDPFSFSEGISRVYDIKGYKWHDDIFLVNKNKHNHYEEPIIIYQIHLSSWKNDNLKELISYVKNQGFTHLEIVFFSDFNLNEFLFFVDLCHQENIGVIIQLEIDDNILSLMKLLYLLTYFHIDGFSIIYKYKDINYQNIEFLRLLNSIIFETYPHTLMIYQDELDLSIITRELHLGGLGFSYKWNLSWFFDVLEYFEEKTLFRKYLHQNIIFSFESLFTERYLLPLSYFEDSLINRMPGDYWEKFANYRLLIGFLMTCPGKKLLFMGNEFAHMEKWKKSAKIDWDLMNYSSHEAINRFVKDLIALYKNEKALHKTDYISNSFLWIDEHNAEKSIFSYIRKFNNDLLLIVLNGSSLHYKDFKLGVPIKGSYEEIINSDKSIYGGFNQVNNLVLQTVNEKVNGFDQSININIPPLGIMIFKLLN